MINDETGIEVKLLYKPYNVTGRPPRRPVEHHRTGEGDLGFISNTNLTPGYLLLKNITFIRVIYSIYIILNSI